MCITEIMIHLADVVDVPDRKYSEEMTCLWSLHGGDGIRALCSILLSLCNNIKMFA